jgi:hypothetical protein
MALGTRPSTFRYSRGSRRVVDPLWIPTELIRSGKTAFVVSDQAHDMSERVLSERANGGLARVALAGQDRIEGAFTFTAVARRWMRLVQALGS